MLSIYGRTSLVLVFATALVSSCVRSAPQNAPSNHPSDPVRAAATGAITIDMTEAPDSWAEIPRGQTQFGGVVEAEEGLHPTEPLEVTVTDLAFDLGTSAVVEFGAPLNSYVNIETGEFFLDVTDDFQIGEGPKEITLTFKDTLSNTESWSVSVLAGEWYQDASLGDEAVAREGYASRLLGVLTEYQGFLGSLRFDETAYPYAQLDLDLLEEIIGMYESAFVVGADMEEWDDYAISFPQAIAEHLQTDEDLSDNEQWFRDEFQTAMDVQVGDMVAARDEVKLWAWALSDGQTGSVTAPDVKLWELAFLNNTFSATEVSFAVDGLSTTFTVQLFVNDGTLSPHVYCCTDVAYEEPEADTWRGNDPVFELTVTASRPNSNADYDTLTYDATIDGEPLEDILDQSPDSYGHLVTPLTAIPLSHYWNPTV